jgi:hypothetical protein
MWGSRSGGDGAAKLSLISVTKISKPGMGPLVAGLERVWEKKIRFRVSWLPSFFIF